MSELTLPWMPRELSPNGRTHWHYKSRVAKSYRDSCHFLALQAKWQSLPCVSAWQPGQKLRLEIDFYKPSNRGDDDNLEAQFKSGRDGLSDAIGIDDKHFVAYRRVAGVVKGGKVVARLSAETK